MREKLGKVKVSVVTKSLLLSGTVVASLLIAPGTVQADTIDNQPLSMSWSNGTTQAAAITSTTKQDQADNLEQTDLHAQDNDYSLAGGAKEDSLVDDDQTTPQADVSPSTDKSLSNKDSVDNELPDVWVNAYFEANGLQTITLPEQGTYTTDDEGVVTFTPLPTFVGQTDTVRLVKESSTGKIAYLNIYSVVTRTITDRSAEDSLPSEPQHEVGEPLTQPEKPTLTIPEHEVGEPLTQPEKPTLTIPEHEVGEPLTQPEKPTLTIPEHEVGEPLTQPEKPTLTIPEHEVGEPLTQPEKPTLTIPEHEVGEPLTQPEKPALTIPEHEVGEPLTQPEKPTLTIPEHEVGEPLTQPEKPTLTIPEHEVGEPLTQPEKPTLTLPAPVVDEPINSGKARPKPLTQPTPVTPTVIDLPVAKQTNDKVGGDLLVPSAQVAAFTQLQPVQQVEHLVTNAVVKTAASVENHDDELKPVSKSASTVKATADVTVISQVVEVKNSTIAMVKAAINSYSDAIMAPNDQTPSAGANDDMPSQHQNDQASVIVMGALLSILGITGSVIGSLAKKFLI